MQALVVPTPLDQVLIKTKIVCSSKQPFSIWTSTVFQKILVARSFEFAKTLVTKVVGF